MSFSKEGKLFPNRSVGTRTAKGEPTYAKVIAAALQQAIQNSNVSINTVACWTGANERTVKNWCNGRYGPSGTYLMALAKHSDEVMEAIIRQSGRDALLVSIHLDEIEQRLTSALKVLRGVQGTETTLK